MGALVACPLALKIDSVSSQRVVAGGQRSVRLTLIPNSPPDSRALLALQVGAVEDEAERLLLTRPTKPARVPVGPRAAPNAAATPCAAGAGVATVGVPVGAGAGSEREGSAPPSLSVDAPPTPSARAKRKPRLQGGAFG